MKHNGVSTKTDKSRGKGLISSERIVQNGLKGQFYIISRNGVVASEYEKTRKLYKLGEYDINGTLVYFRFEIPKKPIDLYQYVE